MPRWRAIAPACLLVLLSACTSAPSSSAHARTITAAVTNVDITRTAGLVLMPALRQQITNAGVAHRLAQDILALPVLATGVMYCPADFGTTYKLVFSPGPWSATVAMQGCRTVQLSDGRGLLGSNTLVVDLGAALGLQPSDLSPTPCASSTDVACYPQPGSGKGLVTGGVKPCEGIPLPNAPRYAAALVSVLKGGITMSSTGQALFPTNFVTRQWVDVNHTYLLALDPGSYVLTAQFPPPANVKPFTLVTVKADAVSQVDIPNMCK